MVPVDSLFDLYLDQVFVAIGPQASPDARDQALRSDLRAVVHCFGETREVTVPEVAWTKLLTARDWVESQDAGSKGRGRPEKAWSDLFPYLINEMLGPDAKLNEKSKNMAERVLQAAKANGAQNLPAENSLKDRINVIYRELNALRKK